MIIFSEIQKIEERCVVVLLNEFKVALEKSNYELCAEVKNEFDRRKDLGLLDKVYLNNMLQFYRRYNEPINQDYVDFINSYLK